MEPQCNYYGNFEGKLKGANVAEYLLDESWLKILEKHEVELRKLHSKIIKDAKDSFNSTIKEFNKKLLMANRRISDLEKAKKEYDKKIEIDNKKISERKERIEMIKFNRKKEEEWLKQEEKDKIRREREEVKKNKEAEKILKKKGKKNGI